MQRAVVIGSGFAGVAAATHVAKHGMSVTVVEKNTTLGGRARQFKAEGFTFDMGPSWYWMPDVFEKHFAAFGKKPSDYYDLVRLDPSYHMHFGHQDRFAVPASLDELQAMFEELEPGSARKLTQFLSEAEYKYNLGINDLVRKPGRSFAELLDKRLISGLFKMHVLTSIRKHVRKYFSHPKLIALMEFPVLFLGATPQDTPALYSLMNYADIALGTWYPMGGFGSVIRGMIELAKEQGVRFHAGEEVKEIVVNGGKTKGVLTNKGMMEADVVIAGADYHHVDQQLLKNGYKNYSKKYWEGRKLAPSVLMFYLGINKKLDGLGHHDLFFDESLDDHAAEIYKDPRWPSKPLFYTSCTSKTDPSTAPAGKENLVILIPIAPGLEDDQSIRDHYFAMVMDRLEALTGQQIRKHVIYNRSYSVNDLSSDYNAYKGNAYGLANTLSQTANLRPSVKSKKVDNLYFTGQLTVPGPGVPPSLISGEVVAKEVLKDLGR